LIWDDGVFSVEKSLGIRIKGVVREMVGKSEIFNATVSVLAVLAWLTSTNHSTLEHLKQPEEAAASMASCPEHAQKSGGSNNDASGMLACCQGLQSPNIQLGKTKIFFNPVLARIQLFAIGDLVFRDDPRSIVPSAEYDTGPPLGNSFVETVLQLALRENAPPLVS
jgi:hypothetical protein